jgi:hypothetical protein
MSYRVVRVQLDRPLDFSLRSQPVPIVSQSHQYQGGVSFSQRIIKLQGLQRRRPATETKPDPNYPLDGRDLLPICKGERAHYERKLFWRHARQNAVRDGKWKYLNDGMREYLFNLSIDQREQADFKDQNPDLLRQLQVEFQAWQAQVLSRPESGFK